MMDMRPADIHIVKWTSITVSGVSHCARHCKRDEESDSRQEKPALGPITDMCVKKFAHSRIVKKQKDGGDSHEN